MQSTKIPHCQINSKIKYENRRKRQNQYLQTEIHSWLCTDTSIKGGRVKLHCGFIDQNKFKKMKAGLFKWINNVKY
jgi:hypothetical protein